MASSPAAAPPSLALVQGTARRRHESKRTIHVAAAAGGPRESTAPRRNRGTPGVDTRIHWDDPEEGWLGVGESSQRGSVREDRREASSGERIADLIGATAASHYQFLGVTPEADAEEIKAAYRRLSKEYHPDTTSLPLKAASMKFMRLREAYNVLSKEESRRFYDWTLAQEAQSKRAERMRMGLEDPYEQELRNWESVPDMVDRLGGRNMKLSDQAMTALGIDVVVVFFSICCIIYAACFKEF